MNLLNLSRGGSPSATPGLVELGHRPPLVAYLKEVAARREFVYALAAGQLRAQHLNTVLGNVWHLLNPVMLIGVYYFIFGVLIERVQEDLVARHISYIAFLAVGIFTFGFLQRCVIAGSGAILGNLPLIRSLQFPRAVLPLANVTKESLGFVPIATVMASVLVLTGRYPDWWWLGFVPLFVVMVLFGLGASMIMARLTEQLPDLRNALPFAFRMLFYLSGVIFDVDRAASRSDTFAQFTDLLLLNPFYVLVSLARVHLLTLPTTQGTAALWLAGTAWAGAVLVVGTLYFAAAEKRYGRG